MAPNTLPEITYKRSKKRESYWQKTKFASPAYYEEELGKLIGKQIPVHAFYLKTEAEQAFKKIADRSGGQSGFIDQSTEDKGANALVKLLSIHITMDVLNKKSYRKEDSMEVESTVIRTLKRSRSPEIFFPNKIQAVSANQILAHSPIFTSSSQIPATLRQSSFCSNVFKTNELKYQRIPEAGHCLYRAVELYVGKSQEELHISEFRM